MISTTELNKITHDMWCKALGIDRYEVDMEARMSRKPDEVVEDVHSSIFGMTYRRRRNFYCPVIHWWIKGKKYSAAIPVKIKTERYSNFISSGLTNTYDWDNIQEEAFKLIKESKKYV